MSKNYEKLPVYYLRPGELHIADHPGIVTTVLGSCVSVTMFSRRREVGAICHGLMPERTEIGRSGRDHGQGHDGRRQGPSLGGTPEEGSEGEEVA